jgi:hypothetical protein
MPKKSITPEVEYGQVQSESTQALDGVFDFLFEKLIEGENIA